MALMLIGTITWDTCVVHVYNVYSDLDNQHMLAQANEVVNCVVINCAVNIGWAQAAVDLPSPILAHVPWPAILVRLDFSPTCNSAYRHLGGAGI